MRNPRRSCLRAILPPPTLCWVCRACSFSVFASLDSSRLDNPSPSFCSPQRRADQRSTRSTRRSADAKHSRHQGETPRPHSCRAPFLSHHAQAYCNLGMVSHTTHHATSRQRGHTSRQHTRCVCTRAGWAGIRLTYGRFHHLPWVSCTMAIPFRRAHCFPPNDTCVASVVCVVCGVFSSLTCPSPNLAHLLATTLVHRSTLDALNTPLNRPLKAT
jgi:hypothetical protein